jgi:arylsulfatase A-like enzyme
MLKQSFLLIIAGGLCLTGSSARAAGSAQRSPNFVLVLIDDYGWTDAACFGSRLFQTPNIDRLMKEGMRFTNAYAAAPVCSPTRAALMTGKYPARIGLTDWLPGRRVLSDQKMLRPAIKQQLPLEETTLAEALKSAGYATALIGKWHLGGKGFEPQRQGFDLNVGGGVWGTTLSYFYPYARNDQQMPGLDQGTEGEHLTDRLTAEAEKFIELNRDRPFFLYLAHYSVHIPLRAKPKLIEKYRAMVKADAPQRNPEYAAMVEGMDESIGRLLKKLDELKLGGDTLFIFTSDNGGVSVREGTEIPITSNQPLRAGKGYLYEGGLRVPLLVRRPGQIKSGSVNNAPVISHDLFATIIDAAGVKSPGAEDGVSLLPLLTGKGRIRRDALYWHYPHYANQGGKPGGVIRAGKYKLIEFYEDNRVELYDLDKDIGEQNDLSGNNPRQAEMLRKKLAAWRNSVNAQTMTPNPDFKF